MEKQKNWDLLAGFYANLIADYISDCGEVGIVKREKDKITILLPNGTTLKTTALRRDLAILIKHCVVFTIQNQLLEVHLRGTLADDLENSESNFETLTKRIMSSLRSKYLLLKRTIEENRWQENKNQQKNTGTILYPKDP